MTGTISLPLRVGRWQHVSDLSRAGFTVLNLGFKIVKGTVPIIDAWVDVDPSGQPAAVRATLDLDAIDTGIAKRDADLRKPRLLDTANHPVMTFVGDRPRPVETGWQIPGRLEVRATADVTLEAQIVQGGEAGEAGEVSVRATVTVDRRRLGVTAPRLMIGRYVSVTIDAVFRPPN
jgi:polyisoprenoid-binding protein YceI